MVKWYGINLKNFDNNAIRNYKSRHNFKIKSLSLFLKPRMRLNSYKACIYLPPKWGLVVIKPSITFIDLFTLFIYSPLYFFYITIPYFFSRIRFDKTVYVINLKFLYVNNFFNTYWDIIKNVFYSFAKVFFKKIKFKGKGYYIYKNYRNTIAMQFGYSHRLRIYSYFLSVKFITKTSVLLFGMNKDDIYRIGFTIFYKKPINVFTGKGIRFTRQVMYKNG
jgi:ribosomal protein L6P/L9E